MAERITGWCEMFGGVFADRRVTTAHVAAGLALAQGNPLSAFFQAFFAANGCLERCKFRLR
jgi:hypothetical protein